jgi:hypothetical protein
MRKLLYVGILAVQPAWAAEPIDVGFELASSLPRQLVEYLHNAEDLDRYVLDSWLNPFYVQGDFNGDESLDTAVLVRERETNKAGILIAHGGVDESFILGAGNAFGNGGDDFSWLGAWYVMESYWLVFDEDELVSHDALYVEKLEAASGVIHWTGNAYEWTQLGD